MYSYVKTVVCLVFFVFGLAYLPASLVAWFVRIRGLEAKIAILTEIL